MIPGVDVYKKEDIPEDFHFKRGKLVHDFLLVAKSGFSIVGLKGPKQIPNDGKASSAEPYVGIHGYQNMPDMKTVFFANGPGKINVIFYVPHLSLLQQVVSEMSSTKEFYSGIMNGYFFPAFKKGILHPPIRLEDEYQIFMHILRLKPRPNNGTWTSVENMFTID